VIFILDSGQIRMTENIPSVYRGFGTVQKLNGKFYVLGGDSMPGILFCFYCYPTIKQIV